MIRILWNILLGLILCVKLGIGFRLRRISSHEFPQRIATAAHRGGIFSKRHCNAIATTDAILDMHLKSNITDKPINEEEITALKAFMAARHQLETEYSLQNPRNKRRKDDSEYVQELLKEQCMGNPFQEARLKAKLGK